MGGEWDVVVVGAGPAGLLLAIELRLGGAEVRVLERLEAPSRAVKGTAIGPLGAEALARRGMGAALAAAEDAFFARMGPGGAERRAQSLRARGHFAALPLRPAPEDAPGRRMVWVDQQGIEAILAQRAAALGIEVRRGCEVTAVDPGEDGVTLRWSAPDGPGGARAAWLVGCDGGRSTIRKLAGFAFPGTDPSVTMYQAVLDLDHPKRLPRGPTRSAEGVVMNGPRPRWLAMHDYAGHPIDRDAPVTREEIEAVLRRISGADVRVSTIDQANRFSDSARLVDTYRRGRILLAGDAAHIHSPLGGQGLSLGLGDAANLGWKLAAVARGDRPEALLDSYEAERRPVAESVLANTLAQIALSRPDPHSVALREIVGGLMRFGEVDDHLAGLTSGLATRYPIDGAGAEAGDLVGDCAIGADAPTLYEEMADGDGVLIDAGPAAAASALAAPYDRLRCRPASGGRSLLIRPDGCVAWSGEGGEVDGLANALDRWFAPRR